MISYEIFIEMECVLMVVLHGTNIRNTSIILFCFKVTYIVIFHARVIFGMRCCDWFCIDQLTGHTIHMVRSTRFMIVRGAVRKSI